MASLQGLCFFDISPFLAIFIASSNHACINTFLIPRILDVYPRILDVYPNILDVYPNILDVYPSILDVYPSILEVRPNILDVYPRILDVWANIPAWRLNIRDVRSKSRDFWPHSGALRPSRGPLSPTFSACKSCNINRFYLSLECGGMTPLCSCATCRAGFPRYSNQNHRKTNKTANKRHATCRATAKRHHAAALQRRCSSHFETGLPS